MTWFKIDDGFADHPKVLELLCGPAGSEALALWLLAGTWCAKQLTDGALPTVVVHRLGVANSGEAARELVRVGLWTETDTGFQFHEWNAWQPTRADVEAKREQARARKAQWRETKKRKNATPSKRSREESQRSSQRPSQRDNPTCHGVTSAMSRSPRPVPSRPSLSRERDPAREPPPPPHLDKIKQAKSALKRSLNRRWLEHTASPPSPAMLAEVEGVGAWWADYHGRCPEQDLAELIDRSIATFLRSRAEAGYDRPRVKWYTDDPGLWLDGGPRSKKKRQRDRSEQVLEQDNRELERKHEAMERESVDPEEARRLAAEAIGAVVGRSKGMFPKKHPDVKRAERNDESRRQRDALREVGS